MVLRVASFRLHVDHNLNRFVDRGESVVGMGRPLGAADVPPDARHQGGKLHGGGGVLREAGDPEVAAARGQGIFAENRRKPSLH